MNNTTEGYMRTCVWKFKDKIGVIRDGHYSATRKDKAVPSAITQMEPGMMAMLNNNNKKQDEKNKYKIIVLSDFKVSQRQYSR